MPSITVSGSLSIVGQTDLSYDKRYAANAKQLRRNPKSLTVWGDSILKGGITGAGTLSIVGQTDLYDNARVGSAALQAQGNPKSLTVYGNETVQGTISATSDVSTSARVLANTVKANGATKLTLDDSVDVVGTLSAPAIRVFNIQTSSGTSTSTGNPVTDFLQIRNEANQLIASFNGASMTASLSTSLTLTQPAYFGAVEATSVKLGDNDLQALLNDKQAKLILWTLPSSTGTSAGRLFDLDSVYFRSLQVSAPLSITTSANPRLSISSDAYSMGEVDDLFQNVTTQPVSSATAAELAQREWTISSSASIVKTLTLNTLTGGYLCGLSLSPDVSVTT